ncbi:MAG: tetratricopeptide repeat protein [Terriglobia bacterium]
MHDRENMSGALAAVQRADFPEAIEILQRVLAQDSSNAEAWEQLGVCYLETRQPELALEALTRALKAGAEGAMTHCLLGHAYGSMGRLEPAAACYRNALKADPGHVKAEEFLIRAESLLESREHYRNALKLLYVAEPSARDLNLALRDLVQSVAIFSDSPARDNLRDCARKLFALRTEWLIPRPVAADRAPWSKACEQGYLCIGFGNWQGARAAYETALAYGAGDAFVHHALGFCFVELGDLGDAVDAWLRVLELDSEYDFRRFGRVVQD